MNTLKVGDVVRFNGSRDLKMVVTYLGGKDHSQFIYFNTLTQEFIYVKLPEECVTKIEG